MKAWRARLADHLLQPGIMPSKDEWKLFYAVNMRGNKESTNFFGPMVINRKMLLPLNLLIKGNVKYILKAQWLHLETEVH